MCIPFEQVDPPTPRAHMHVNNLRIVMFAHMFLIGMKLFVSSGYTIFELFTVFILYQGLSRLDFCNLIIYIFCISLNLMQVCVFWGSLWQNKISFQYVRGFLLFVMLIALIFYSLAIYFVFLAYREFKAIAKEDNSGGSQQGSYAGQQDLQLQQNPRRDQEAQRDEPNAGFGVFGGIGQAFSTPPQNAQTKKTEFVPFQGRGVALG